MLSLHPRADSMEVMCNEFSVDEHGCFADSSNIILALRHLRPDLAEKRMVGQIVAKSASAFSNPKVW